MKKLENLSKWHEKLADLYLEDSNKEKHAEFLGIALKQEKIRDEQTLAWKNSKLKDVDARDRANAAMVSALQNHHLAEVAKAKSNAKSHVIHRLVLVQINAMIAKTSIDDAVYEEMKRLLSHTNKEVQGEARIHPNRSIVVSREVYS